MWVISTTPKRKPSACRKIERPLVRNAGLAQRVQSYVFPPHTLGEGWEGRFFDCPGCTVAVLQSGRLDTIRQYVFMFIPLFRLGFVLWRSSWLRLALEALQKAR